jgi:hypothetical protein
MSLGDMGQRGLDDGHSLMGSPRMGVSSGAMVVSMVSLLGAFASV